MPDFMDMSTLIPLERLERLIRTQVARAGEIWVFADAARLRRLRQLAARFTEEPIAGGGMWFFGPPPQPPHTDAWPGETDPDAGGLLIISARADIGPGLLFLVAA